MKTLSLAVLLPMLVLASCASDPKPDPAAAAPVRKPLSERINEKNGYKQDADGNWKVESDRRSPYEGKGATYDSKKSFQKKDYRTGDFAKKSWWGNKQVERQVYAGDTDGSRFQKPSALQGQNAREGDDLAKIPDPYQTDSYATSAARETRAGAIDRPADAAIESRRKKFKQPEIVDWREQRSLSLDQSRGILGR